MAFMKKKKVAEDQSEVKLTWKQNLIVSIHDMISVLAVFLLIYMLLFRMVVVVGPSMYDTLIQGDRVVLLSSLVYRNPKPGDIIVASLADFKGGECIVKRVIATEGQIVDIDFERGVVFVDGEEIDEPYIHSYTYNQQGVSFPLIVQKGHVFVLGDNRESSLDSRSYEIGQIDRREILGKAIFLLIPGDNDGLEKPRYDRIGVIK